MTKTKGNDHAQTVDNGKAKVTHHPDSLAGKDMLSLRSILKVIELAVLKCPKTMHRPAG